MAQHTPVDPPLGAPALAAPAPAQPGASSPARYAAAMFGTSIPINLVGTLGTYFYLTVIGLPATSFALVMGIYAVIDAVDNPIYGYLSDRTRSRFGRRRPWILAATPVLAVGLVLYFAPPDAMTGTMLVIWLAVLTILTGTADSMINANYGALLPELFRDERRRAVANGMRQGLQLVAMILSVALAPALVDRFGYLPVAVVFGAVAGVVIIVSVMGAREDPAVRAAARPRIIASVLAMGRNPKFWMIALTSGAYSSGMALVLASATFFVTLGLGGSVGDASYVLVSVIGASVLCLMGWTVLVRRFGPERVWRIALIVLALALANLARADSLLTASLYGVLVGLGYSGVMATMDLIVARLLDEDTARTGQRREAMFLSAFGFFNRLNAAFIALAFLLASVIFGFESGQEPGDRPEDAVRFLTSAMPAIAVALAALGSFFVRFGRPAITDRSPVPGPDTTGTP